MKVKDFRVCCLIAAAVGFGALVFVLESQGSWFFSQSAAEDSRPGGYSFTRHMNSKCKNAIDASIAVDQQQCSWDVKNTKFHEGGNFIEVFANGKSINKIPLCRWEVKCRQGIWGINGTASGSGINYANDLHSVARCDSNYDQIRQDCKPLTKANYDARQQDNPWIQAVYYWCQANPKVSDAWGF